MGTVLFPFCDIVLCIYISINMEEEINVNVEEPTPVVNTDDTDYGIPDLRAKSDETQAADFTTGPFVTRRNPAAEITSMLSSLYISDDEKSDDEDDDDDESCGLNVQVVQTMQTEIDKLKVDLLALSAKVQSNEQDVKQSVESSLNRETNFREAVDASLADLEDYFRRSFEKLEKAVADCFLRRDTKWESQMKKLRFTSTPSHTRLQSYMPAHSISPVPDFRTPMPTSRAKLTPTQNVNATYDISSVAPLTQVPNIPVVHSISSFCGRPPIRLDFPTFGDSCETSEVLNFIEQCETI